MIRRWVQPGQEYDALERYISTRVWGYDKPMSKGTILAVIDGSALAGACLFHNYEPDAGVIEISAAADSARWLTRPVLYDMFDYAFGQLGCQAVVARMDPDAKRTCGIFDRYGFTQYIVPRLRGRAKDEAIYLLTEEAWRTNGFHKENENGQVSTKTDAAA